MFVCEKCLAAITSREGIQHERKVYADGSIVEELSQTELARQKHI